MPAPVTPSSVSVRTGSGSGAACRRAVVVRSSVQTVTTGGKVYDAVIVGAGISGLTTAQALVCKHSISNFLVTEARERVGGNITSMEGDGFVWEEGPNSFQPNDSMLQIAVGPRSTIARCADGTHTHARLPPPPQVDAGCDKNLVFGDPTAPRFVYWDKKLRATPSGLDAVTFDLLTLFGKIRAGLGAVGIWKDGPPPE
ncbi:hypothetical protein FOA52_011442 [Chlamydomonas sp. UWO 241]|nr:hypothetical protein FOA52_011442 [Chlamydomonas sp. UWO 241]